MLLLQHCSNPDCHRPYTPDNYCELLTLRHLANNEMNFFVISICARCMHSVNDVIVSRALRDAVDYEIAQNNSSILLTKEQKMAYRTKQSNYRLIAWGKDREELEAKLKQS